MRAGPVQESACLCSRALVCYGASEEAVLLRSSASRLLQHFNVLRGLKPPLNLSTKIFGKSVRLPFFPSPTAGQRMWHPSGEACVAKVAMEKGMAYGLSSLATTSISEAAQACPRGPKVFQLYVWKDRGLLRQVISQVFPP